MEIIAPDGGLWMRLHGWEDWRFYWAPTFYDFWRFPNKGMLSEHVELPLPEDCRGVECLRMKPFEEIRTRIWETLWAHLILSRRELAQYGGMTDDARRKEWLFGRAVAKDAVRTWVKRHYGLDLYPADVEIDNDEHGAPHAGGRWVSRIGIAPQLTLSHKGTVAVAAAGTRALGIDLERIEARDSGFDALVFDETELQLFSRLNGDNRTEWVTRAWCAKEAASKATGRGLSDGPQAMMVNSIDPGLGQLVVSRREPLSGRRSADVARQFTVHSVRDGEFVIALAVDEGNSGDDV